MSKNNHQNRQLTAKQNKAIDSLLAGSDKQTAAAVAGVTPRTLSRWMSEANFGAELQAQSMAVRLRASMATIDNAMRLVEAVDVLERLRSLETIVKGMRK